MSLKSIIQILIIFIITIIVFFIYSKYFSVSEKDIITKMNDVVVTHKTFATMVASLEPGTKITLEVIRDKKIIIVGLRLGYRSE